MLTGAIAGAVLALLITFFPMKITGKERSHWKTTAGISVALILGCVAFVKAIS